MKNKEIPWKRPLNFLSPFLSIFIESIYLSCSSNKVSSYTYIVENVKRKYFVTLESY